MRRIRILQAVGGSDFSWSPGDLVDLPDAVAAGWADGHRAVWAEPGDAGSEPTPLVQTQDGVVLAVISAVYEAPEPDADAVAAGPALRQWTVTVDLPDDLAAALEVAPADGMSVGLQGEPVPAGALPVVPVPAGGPEEAPPFDPGEHRTADVLAYLADVGELEAVRVLDAEVAGQDRRGIAKLRSELVERARANDAEQAGGQDHGDAEKAADASRGGGRGDLPETR